MTTIEIAPTTGDLLLGDSEMSHASCCRDDDVSLCGIDVSGLETLAPASTVDCIVCRELDECSVCPLTGQVCPEVGDPW